MARRRGSERLAHRRGGNLVWEIAPLLVLAGAGVALLRPPRPYRTVHEAGRGREATSPAEIPIRGWKDIVLRAKNRFFQDQVPMLAAGVTFFALLALSPAMAAFVALYGLFADMSEVQSQLRAMAAFLPASTLDLLGEQMTRLINVDKSSQSLALVAGALAAVWSANGAVSSLITGLNVAYAEDERRSWLQRTVIALGFTVGFLAFLLAAVALVTAGPAIEPLAGPRLARIIDWISWPLLLLCLMFGLALLYRFGPSREPMRWKWITWGSAGVVMFWLVDSALFSTYVNSFSRYDRTYGALGAVIGFMMWIYLWILVVLAGAELNAEIEHQTTIDTTTGPPRPMGYRHAFMADTVGAAQVLDEGDYAGPRLNWRRVAPLLK
jgi:membrane protein